MAHHDSLQQHSVEKKAWPCHLCRLSVLGEDLQLCQLRIQLKYFFFPKNRQTPAITCYFSFLYLSLKDRNLINSLMPGKSEGKQKAKAVYLENICFCGQISEDRSAIEQISQFWKRLKFEKRQPYFNNLLLWNDTAPEKFPCFTSQKVYNQRATAHTKKS